MNNLHKILLLLVFVVCLFVPSYEVSATATEIEVFFDSCGGSYDTTRLIVPGETYVKLPTPWKEGYTLVGWFTQKTGGTQITADMVVTSTSNYTLYARWTPAKSTAYFKPGAGEIVSGVSEKTVTWGEPYGELPIAHKQFLKFVGWRTESGEMITKDTIVKADENHYIYAVYETLYMTCTFDANGGTASYTTTIVSALGYFDEFPTVTRPGYTFNGWYTERSGGKRIYLANCVRMDGDFTAYAHWTPNTYNVTFDANGGVCSEASRTVVFDTVLNNLPVPTLTGYVFKGWYTSLSGGSLYSNGSKYITPSDVTLYAKWEKEKVVTEDSSQDTPQATYQNTTPTSVKKVSSVKGKRIKVSLKKKKGFRYHIQVSTSKKFKKIVKSCKTAKTTYTFKKLKKGKTYYVRVRTYKKVNGNVYYSKWSAAKKVKVKR